MTSAVDERTGKAQVELEAAEAELADRVKAQTAAGDAYDEVHRRWLHATERAGGKDTRELAKAREAVRDAELRQQEADHLAMKARERVQQAEQAVTDEELAERRARIAELVDQRIELARKIDRDVRKLCRSVDEYHELADTLLVASSGEELMPSVRQIRGIPHLVNVIIAPLAERFPRDLHVSHHYRDDTAYEREKILFRFWLNGGGQADDSPTTAEDE